MNKLGHSLFYAAIALVSASQAAQAALNRVWVSAHGVDGLTCGAVVSPCRQIKYALDNNIVAPGGEIDILDPSGFAAFTITHAISIVNDGVGTASIQQGAAGQNAITINAGAGDSVHLRGLSLEGLGTGYAGVFLNSAGSLTVIGCIARHFSNSGFWLQPNANYVRFNISNVIASDNGQYGIIFYPSQNVSIDYSVVSNSNIANNNSAGIMVSTNLAGNVFSTIDIDNNIVIGNASGGQGAVPYGDIAVFGGTAVAVISRNTFRTAYAGGGASYGNITSYGDNSVFTNYQFALTHTR